MSRARGLAVAGLCAALSAGCGDSFSQGLRIAIEGAAVVDETPLPDGRVERRIRARCANRGPDAHAVVAVAVATRPGVELADPTLRCGPLEGGGEGESLDTVTLREPGGAPFDAAALAWIAASVGPTEASETGGPGGERRLDFRASLSNGSAEERVATLFASSRSPDLRVVDDSAFATALPGATTVSGETVGLVLGAGAELDPTALALTLSLAPPGFEGVALVRTLDGDGLPLGGVAIEEIGARGAPAAAVVSDAESGLATLAFGSGKPAWRFSRDGHHPVWRRAKLGRARVSQVPSPRLAARAAPVALGDTSEGTLADGTGSVSVAFPAGAFANGATGHLTRLDGQSLPALLPAGWSPLAAFWLELDAEPALPGALDAALDDALEASDRAALVRFDEARIQWRVQELVAGSGEARVGASLPAAGAWAVVVADAGDGAPPDPVTGAALLPASLPAVDPDTLAGSGAIAPASRPASADAEALRAEADVAISGPAGLPSGLLVLAEIAESYRLREGGSIVLPGYESFLVAYRRPDASRAPGPPRVRARFPLRPRLALGPDALVEGRVQVDVRAVEAFEGGLLGPEGGVLAAAGVEIAADAGDVPAPRAADLTALDPASFADLLPAGASAGAAFQLSVEPLAAGRALEARFAPQAPNAFFVLARAVHVAGRSGLLPVERLASDGAGLLASLEPASGDRLAGLDAGGAYVLVQIAEPQGLVLGNVRGAGGAPAAGVAASITGQRWLAGTDGAGGFRLLAPPGEVEASASAGIGGDEGRAEGTLADAASGVSLAIELAPAGPRVAEIVPADGATSVDRVTPVRITFSEPLAPGSFGPDALVVSDAAGARIAGSLGLDLARRTATFLAASPLAPATAHTVALDAGIRDAQGLALEGASSFSFTTEAPAAREAGAQLVSWEPGAETSPCGGDAGAGLPPVPGFDPSDPEVSCVRGSAGTADPNAAVVLVNETRGTTATVLARPDGSFTSFIDADVDDFLAATFVNANDTRVRVPLSRQSFDDGSVALFQGGGILEAQGDGGPIQILIEPGTIQSKNKFKLEPLDRTTLLALLDQTEPEDAQMLGGIRVTIEGEAPEGKSDFSMAVNPAALDLPPGVPPEEGAFALAVARKSGENTVFEVVDKLRYQDGRIASNTFPFLTLFGLAGDASDLFSLIVVPLLLGGRPVTITGKVKECAASPEGECLGLSPAPGVIPDLQVKRALGGAFVTLRSPSVKSAQLGQLDAGMVYATSQRDGTYALVAPSLGSGYILTATHPKHAAPVTEPVFSLLDFGLSGAIEKELVFPATFGAQLSSPPRVSAAHEPVYPTSGQAATLQVDAQHPGGALNVSILLESVESLVPGVPVSPEDVQIGEEVTQMPSPTRKRVTAPVSATSDKALLARIRVRASVAVASNVPPVEIVHAIAFGVGPAQAPNEVVAADANDEVGPVVVTTIPQGGAVGFTAGEAITLFFNEPIDASVEQEASAISLAGGSGSPAISLDLSPDQRSLIVHTGRLDPDTSYTLSVSSAVRDLSGNPFDQEPGTPGNQGFTLELETASEVRYTLPGIGNGQGAVLGRGGYAFAIDADDRTLAVIDVSQPATPFTATEKALPGFPRDLVFIPQYSWKLRADGPAKTGDLLLVVGGDLGSTSIDAEGNVFLPPQYLRVFDVTDPTEPFQIAAATLARTITTITKAVWRAPFLAYLLNGADGQSVSFLHLQELILGSHLLPEEVALQPIFGFPGEDNNGDGDYVDAGDDTHPADKLPKPARTAEFFGKRGACVVDDTTQRILDFDFYPGFCAVTLGAGFVKLNNGEPSSQAVPPGYRSLEVAGEPLDRDAASVLFGDGDRPKRVAVRFDVRVGQPDGSIESRNLAFVSVVLASGGSELVAIDISLPESPVLLRRLAFGDELGLGLLQSLFDRPDGLLAVATTSSLALIDPTQLGLPDPPPGVLHPAVVGVVPGAGSGANVDGNAAGVHVVSLGSRSEVVQSAPRLRFVSFGGGGAPVDPEAIAGDDADVAAELARMRVVESVAASRVRSQGGAISTLSPPARESHTHVLIDLPGGAGDEVELTLESLNRAGRPLGNLGRSFPPVRAATAETLESLGQVPRPGCDAPTQSFTAVRLSDDRQSPYYNLYLSRPFALTYERLSASELQALQDELPRAILWSGHFVRAAIDPQEDFDPSIGAFASKVDVDQKVVRPGASIVARSLPAPYVVGPNPPPPAGAIDAPGSFGMVNAANGELRHETVDLVLPSRVMPIVFQRAIGGQDLHEGPFGRGWDLNLLQRIVPLEADVFPPGLVMPIVQRASDDLSVTARSRDVLWHTGVGRVIHFRHVGSSAPPELAGDPLLEQQGWLSNARDFYLPEPGVFDALLRFDDGQYLRVTPDGTQFWYAAGGRLERIYHRYEKNQHVLSYNERDELVRVDDRSVADDRFVRVGYHRFAQDPIFDDEVDVATAEPFVAGKIARLRDSAGRDVLFTYNADGMLARRESFLLAGANGGFAGRPVTEYIATEQCAGDLTGVIAGEGANGAPLFAAQVEGAGVQPSASTGTGAAGGFSITPPANNQAASADGSTTTTQSAGATTELSFDALGLPAQIVMTGPLAEPASYDTQFDTQGRLERVVQPEGDVIEMTYDVESPSLRSRANRLAVTRIPGPRGGPTIAESWSYDARYNQRSGPAIDANGNLITYELTGDGKDVESIGYAADGAATFAHNEYGQIEATTDAEGVTRSYGYDLATGYRLSETVGGHTTTYGYDGSIAAKLGAPTTIVPPEGFPAMLAYDERLLLLESTRGTLVERIGYDANGNPVRAERAVDAGVFAVERRAYDQIGFLREVTEEAVPVDGAPADLTTTIEPDAAFRPRLITYPGGETKEISYDHRGNPVSVKRGDLEETYTLDRHGNLLEIREGGELTATFAYDGHDRVVSVTRPMQGGDAVWTLDYFGGGQLRAVEVTDPELGLVQRWEVKQLDALGRPKLVERGAGADLAATNLSYATSGSGGSVDASGPQETTTTSWDAAGRLASVSDSVRTTSYAIDGNGRIEAIASIEDGVAYDVSQSFDGLDHREAASDGVGLIQTFTPRIDGNAVEVSDALDRTTTQGFSVLGELLSRTRPNGVGIELQYDSQRLPAAILDRAGLGNRFEYDGAFQLQTLTLRDGVRKLEITARDPRGNPEATAIPGGTQTSTYDLQGRALTHEYAYGAGEDYQLAYTYDALGRIRGARYGAAGENAATHTYDLLGPMLDSVFEEGGQTFTIGRSIRSDGAREDLTYPSGLLVDEQRDAAGRLVGISADAPLYAVTQHRGLGLPGEIQLAGGAIQETRVYDGRRRMRARRYTAGGRALGDVRVEYDAADDPRAVQHAHRAGRTDFFAFDEGRRIVRADVDARPDSGSEIARPLAGFAPVVSGFLPGRYARTYAYDALGLDLLENAALVDPDPGDAPLFAQSRAAHDGLLHARLVDGFDRGEPDPLGGTARTRLAVREPGAAAPALVPATLVYDGMGHLVRVARDDGVVVEYDYHPWGTFHRRRVTRNGTLTSDRAYVWDGPNLIEEIELAGGTSERVGRYFYAGEDSPFAADLRGPGGALTRFWLVRDPMSSVLGVADATGNVRERMRYDAFGQPALEREDTQKPRIARVVAATDGVRVVFSEPVLPLFTGGASDAIEASAQSIESAVEITRAGFPIAATARLEEGAPGFASGSVVRVQFAHAAAQGHTLRLAPGSLVDEWGNANDEMQLAFVDTALEGSVVFQAADASSTAPEALARSAVGNPFLFHGQWFDYDTGLLFLRARFYDPYSGQFLQLDPAGYADSVNLYAGFANNPVAFRDPLGTSIADELVLYVDDAAKVAEDVARVAAKGRNLAKQADIAAATGAKVARGSYDAAARNKLSMITARRGGERSRSAGRSADRATHNDTVLDGDPVAVADGDTVLDVDPLRTVLGGAPVGGGARRTLRLTTPAVEGDVASEDYVVSFMGKNGRTYYDKAGATLGAQGGTVWVAPGNDIARVASRSDAVVATGLAPGPLASYLAGDPIYGIAVPRRAVDLRLPSAQSRGANRHFRFGGYVGAEHQATGTWSSSDVREYVIRGGDPVPKGSVFFQFNADGSWTPIRRF
jgi:RHS repeat-associated protein